MTVVSLSRPTGGPLTSILGQGGGFNVFDGNALTVPAPSPAGLFTVNGFGAATTVTVPTPSATTATLTVT